MRNGASPERVAELCNQADASTIWVDGIYNQADANSVYAKLDDANNAGRGLSSDDLASIKAFAEKSSSIEELQTLICYLKITQVIIQ